MIKKLSTYMYHYSRPFIGNTRAFHTRNVRNVTHLLILIMRCNAKSKVVSALVGKGMNALCKTGIGNRLQHICLKQLVIVVCTLALLRHRYDTQLHSPCAHRTTTGGLSWKQS